MDPSTEAQPSRGEGRLARLRRAPATTGLMVTLAVVFLASELDPALVYACAKDGARIREGEVWRLVTAGFFHAGLIHLAVNEVALSAIGPTVEALYGAAWFLVVFLVGSVAGFTASTAFVDQPSLGASAGLFALLGILLAFPYRARHRISAPARRAMTREILMVAGLNLAVGLLLTDARGRRVIDNAAHVGGFLAGLVLGLLLRPREPA